MNIEVKEKTGNERIQSLVIQYSVFDIRHSEKYKNSELGIVTQPEGPRPYGVFVIVERHAIQSLNRGLSVL